MKYLCSQTRTEPFLLLWKCRVLITGWSEEPQILIFKLYIACTAHTAYTDWFNLSVTVKFPRWLTIPGVYYIVSAALFDRHSLLPTLTQQCPLSMEPWRPAQLPPSPRSLPKVPPKATLGTSFPGHWEEVSITGCSYFFLTFGLWTVISPKC